MNSVFQPDQSFFVLDSDHLREVSSRLYGYTFLHDRVADSLEALRGESPSPEGVWILVRREEGLITVSQDFIGTFGLYLFRKENYFALSNSFLYLLEHLASAHRLTLNREYTDYLLCADVASSALGETPVQEIEWLDRCAVVEINIAEKSLRIRQLDYRENTVDPSSSSGLNLLDAWWEKWRGRFRNCALSGKNIRADLSGGFDSRLTLGLLLSAGVDMNRILINSNTDGLHTHAEDYRIASAIAEYYGFQLNNGSCQHGSGDSFIPEEILGASLYAKLGFHKQLYYKYSRHHEKWYAVNGYGGACIREYWWFSEEEYIQKSLYYCNVFSDIPASQFKALQMSVCAVLHRSLNRLREKFIAYGRPLDESKVTLPLYRETRCRNHYGKSMIESWQAHNVVLAPILDPDLHQLALFPENCDDGNFLLALIFIRFAPDLLRFEFEGGRSFREETLQRARETNDRHPYRPAPLSEKMITPGKDLPVPAVSKTPQVQKLLPDALLFNAFRSRPVRQMMESVYLRPIYKAILKDTDVRKHHPLLTVYSALGVCAVVWANCPPSAEATFTEYLLRCADLKKTEASLAKPRAPGVRQKLKSLIPAPLKRGLRGFRRRLKEKNR